MSGGGPTRREDAVAAGVAVGLAARGRGCRACAWEETARTRRRRPGLRLLPSASSPASRPRNELEHRRFDSRARIGWVLLFLCFNDSSQPLGMSCAINFLPLFKAAGMIFFFFLHHPLGDGCL